MLLPVHDNNIIRFVQQFTGLIFFNINKLKKKREKRFKCHPQLVEDGLYSRVHQKMLPLSYQYAMYSAWGIQAAAVDEKSIFQRRVLKTLVFRALFLNLFILKKISPVNR